MGSSTCRRSPFGGRSFTGPISVRQYRRLLIDRTTGLPNYFILASAYAARIKKGRPFAVFALDIKGFGRFNERRGGHIRGNELLRNITIAIRRVLRTGDLLARWSIGDEFILFATIGSLVEIDAIRRRLGGPHSVTWGRRTRLLSCYVVGVPATERSFAALENVLHERLRRVKVGAKLAERN